MTDPGWIDRTLASARPQAVAALLRYFRDLDTAEEAFQDACLRALKNWPKNGPPRDPAAWLIFVGRNAAIDTVRRQARLQPLPEERVLSDLDDAETKLAERLDGADYRDDILRLLFICCHPDLPAVQQIALLNLDPRNITLEPEYYADLDVDKYYRVKPLLWLWEMFDKSILGENVHLGVLFRRVLAQHAFKSCGKNFKAFHFVKFSYGYKMEVGDNVVVHRHVLRHMHTARETYSSDQTICLVVSLQRVEAVRGVRAVMELHR